MTSLSKRFEIRANNTKVHSTDKTCFITFNKKEHLTFEGCLQQRKQKLESSISSTALRLSCSWIGIDYSVKPFAEIKTKKDSSQYKEQAGTGPSRRHIQGSKIAKRLPSVKYSFTVLENRNFLKKNFSKKLHTQKKWTEWRAGAR